MSRNASSTGLLLLLLTFGLGPGAFPRPAAAQQTESQPPEPPAAEAPLQFALGPALSTLRWEDEIAERPDIESATTVGLSVESRVFDAFAIRFGAAYGSTRVVAQGGPTEELRATDANQYLVDLSLVGRAAFGPMEAAGVVPFVTIGAASVVHDPRADDLITRSQSAFTRGAGLDVRILRHLGGRLEWRRYDVSLEDVFADPSSRGGREVSADRFTLELYLRL